MPPAQETLTQLARLAQEDLLDQDIIEQAQKRIKLRQEQRAQLLFEMDAEPQEGDGWAAKGAFFNLTPDFVEGRFDLWGGQRQQQQQQQEQQQQQHQQASIPCEGDPVPDCEDVSALWEMVKPRGAGAEFGGGAGIVVGEEEGVVEGAGGEKEDEAEEGVWWEKFVNFEGGQEEVKGERGEDEEMVDRE